MPSIEKTGQEQLDSVKSRLGRSLLRLHRSLEENREQQDRVDSVFTLWQSKWTSHREQITRRLALIEAQLAKMGTPAEQQPPQLAIIGVPTDGDEMTPMGPL